MAATGTWQGVSCRRGSYCRPCALDALPAVLRCFLASKWGLVRAVYHQSLLYRHQHSTTHKTQTTLQRKMSPFFQMLNTKPLCCTLCFCVCIDSVHSSPGSDSHFLDPLVLEASSASDCDWWCLWFGLYIAPTSYKLSTGSLTFSVLGHWHSCLKIMPKKN